MFGDKLSTANAKITALVALISSSGFKLDASNVLDPKTEASSLPSVEAYTEHLNARVSPSSASATEELTGKLAGATARLGILEAGMQAAGVAIPQFAASDLQPKEGAAIDTASGVALVKGAIGVVVAKASAQQIATTGHAAALDLPKAGSSAAAATEDVAPATKAEFMSQLSAIQDAGKRTAFYRKHSSRFI